MEAAGALDRTIEFLPDDKNLAERAQMRVGLTSPELAVLLAYTKITLKEAILATALPDAPELQQLLAEYFPAALVKQCSAEIPNHPLKREIVTTQLVNRLVNRMGTCFTMQIGDETGADAAQIAAAWYAASELLNGEATWREIEALDLAIPAAQQQSLMVALRTMLGGATRQILAAKSTGTPIAAIIESYRAAIDKAVAAARKDLSGLQAVEALLGASASIIGVFELVDLAKATGKALEKVASTCAQLDASLDLAWLGAAIDRLPANNRWQARARVQLASEVRKLRQTLLQRSADGAEIVASEAHGVIDELKHNAPQDLAMLSAGLAEIKRILAA